MDAITYTSARAHLAETMDRVCDDHEGAPLRGSGLPIPSNGVRQVSLMRELIRARSLRSVFCQYR